MYFDGAIGGISNTVKNTLLGALFTNIRRGLLKNSNVNPKKRERRGEKMGKKMAQEIIENLAEGETIKIVAHSMGTAYSRGMVNAIQKYADENDVKVVFEYELDINSFNGSELPALDIVEQTQYISNEHDGVANGGMGSIVGSSSSEIPNAEEITYPNSRGHSISSNTVIWAIEKYCPYLGTADIEYLNPSGTNEPNSNQGYHSPIHEENPANE